MGKRGRKSAAAMAVQNGNTIEEEDIPRAPHKIGRPAGKLWKEIIGSRPPNYYGPGDLVLLEHYCYITKKLIPEVKDQIDEKFSESRVDTLNKLILRSESLAKDLRICVSSRTKPSSKQPEDSLAGSAPWDE